MRSAKFFVLCWVLVLHFLPNRAEARATIHPDLFGTYHGVFVPTAARGGTLRDSSISLTVDARGVVLGARLPGLAHEWKIAYTEDWVWPDFGDEPCVLIRQSPEAFDYSYRLCVERAGGRLVRVRMTSNLRQTLGEFTRVERADRKGDVRARVHEIYLRHHRDQPLLGLNRHASLIHDGPWADDEKRELLRDIRAEFTSYGDTHLEHFEPLVHQALFDAGSEVRLEALKVFARMPTAASVAPLIQLATRDDLTTEVFHRLIRTLGLYLDTANSILARREQLSARFGSDSVKVAYRRTAGVIFGGDQGTVDLMPFTPRHRAWTIEHRAMLRQALDRIAREAATAEARQLASDVRRVYDPDAGECDARLNGGPR